MWHRLALVLAILGATAWRAAPQKGEPHPSAHRGTDVVERYGMRIEDPYRWLEDVKSEPAGRWASEQRDLLEKFLASGADRAPIRARLQQLADYEQFGTPKIGGSRYFYTYVPKGAPQSARQLLVRSRLSEAPRKLFDGADGRLLGSFAPSPSGDLVAMIRTEPAVRGLSLVVIRTSDGEVVAPPTDLPRGGTAGSLLWSADSKSLFYVSAETVQNGASSTWRRMVVREHRINGTSRTIFEAERQVLPSISLTDDGRHLIMTLQNGSDPRGYVRVADMKGPDRIFRPLVGDGTSAFIYLGGTGNTAWFYTDDGAPKGRVVAVDIKRPERPNWKEIIPEQRDAVSGRDQTGINPLGMFGGRIVLTYVRDGEPYLRIFTNKGTPVATIDLPPAGAIWSGFNGAPNRPEAFFWFLGLLEPSTIYRLDLTSGTLSLFARASLPFDRDALDIRKDMYTSRDGTRVPIFVVQRRGAPRDGSRPAWLYGYGALGWVSFIWYQPHILAWLEMGGVYAQPSIRGGGEYGQAWHHAALKTSKHKALEDYVSAARWLVQQGYTSSSKLVANGGSLSAPLASAAVHQNPDLFGAAIIDRPVTDMLRYEMFSGGSYWAPEFGTVENADEFKSLRAFSAYHNALDRGCRPPTLVMTGELDSTAPPLHAFKLTAALQSSQTCANPVLLKIMNGATHNFGNSPAQQVDSFGDLLGFLATLFRLSPA